jgi:hypothetical protein
MAVVDRLILRLAVYEFLETPETPRRVVIDEALELAKRYSAPDAVKFVNGVLDAVRRRLDARRARRNRNDMTQEAEQIAQRRANLEAIARLGEPPTPIASTARTR